MKIDTDAPVSARGKIHIDAPPERVWSLMADFEGWPSWNPDIASVELQGPIEEGTTFSWKAGPGTITSTLRTVEELRTLAWTGRTLGIKAIHLWQLEPEGEGTWVVTEESWSGVLPFLFRRSLRRTLQKAIEDGPAHLAKAAEQV